MPAHDGDVPGANALLKSTLLTVKFRDFIHLNTGTSLFGNVRVPVHLQACNQGAQILQNSRSHLKLLDARMVTRSMFRTKDPQILGTTIQNLVAMATERTDFVHSYLLSFSPFSCQPK